MPQFVVGALQKRAVHTKDWLGARARKRGGKGHGVFLGNAHVDKLLACRGAKLGCKAHDVGRGSRDAHNLRIALYGSAQGLARNVGIGARRRLARMARAEPCASRPCQTDLHDASARGRSGPAQSPCPSRWRRAARWDDRYRAVPAARRLGPTHRYRRPDSGSRAPSRGKRCAHRCRCWRAARPDCDTGRHGSRQWTGRYR